MVFMTGYTVINNIRLYVGVRNRRRQIGLINRQISVYELDGDNFLLGIFRPAIYMSPQVCKTPELNRHVVLHELQHYKAKDNLWVLVRTICLILQWYNPLMWVAYLESGRDCELACDYRVFRAMNREERLVYGESLLSILRLNVMSRKGVYLTTSMGKDKKFMKKRKFLF